MEIYDFEIRRWTKEFDNIRKVIQTSANFVRWYTPTKRILNLLPPVRDGYFLCTFILKFEHREKPTFFLGYYKMSGCYDALDFSHKGFCCQREDDEGDEGLTPKDYTHVQFRLGYKKNAPTMEFQITDIDINRGDNRMGAPIDQDVIIIKFK